MRLANHRIAEQAPNRPSACLCVRDDADGTGRDTRLAYVAPTRHPGAVGGGRHHPMDIWEPMDPTEQDGCHRVTAPS